MLDQPVIARPRVIVTRELTDGVMARMAELFDVTFPAADAPPSPARLATAMRDADVLVPTLRDQVDAGAIAQAGPRLKLIASFSNGVDHIDLPAARRRGIVVTNTPGVLTQDSADLALALIVSVPRRIVEGDRLVRSGAWSGWSPGAMLGRRITGRTLGIVGMGRIGRAVAARARALGMNIAYHNRKRLPPEAQGDAVFHADLHGLLAASDVVSINCPLTSATQGLIDARAFAAMRDGATLINIARGEIVDEAALIAALTHGRLGGAGLDVHAHEPAVDPALLALPNVVLLPHMGSATYEAREATGERVIANIRAWADGHRPPDQVIEGWASA